MHTLRMKMASNIKHTFDENFEKLHVSFAKLSSAVAAMKQHVSTFTTTSQKQAELALMVINDFQSTLDGAAHPLISPVESLRKLHQDYLTAAVDKIQSELQDRVLAPLDQLFISCEQLKTQVKEREDACHEMDYYTDKVSKLRQQAQYGADDPTRRQRNEVKLMEARRDYEAVNRSCVKQLKETVERGIPLTAKALDAFLELQGRMNQMHSGMLGRCQPLSSISLATPSSKAAAAEGEEKGKGSREGPARVAPGGAAATDAKAGPSKKKKSSKTSTKKTSKGAKKQESESESSSDSSSSESSSDSSSEEGKVKSKGKAAAAAATGGGGGGARKASAQPLDFLSSFPTSSTPSTSAAATTTSSTSPASARYVTGPAVVQPGALVPLGQPAPIQKPLVDLETLLQQMTFPTEPMQTIGASTSTTRTSTTTTTPPRQQPLDPFAF